MAHGAHAAPHAAGDDTHVIGRFRLELVIAIRLSKMVTWWTSNGNTKKYHSPFVDQDPYFVIPEFAKAAELDKQTQGLFAEGKSDENRSNRHTLVEVLIASALFLYGIASVTRRYSIKLGFLGLGLVLFALSVVQLARVRWG